MGIIILVNLLSWNFWKVVYHWEIMGSNSGSPEITETWGTDAYDLRYNKKKYGAVLYYRILIIVFS